MNNRKLGYTVIAVCCVVLTPAALWLAFVSARLGHGDYFWAKVLFPYTMLSTLLFDVITVPFVALAVCQIPAYGIIAALAFGRARLARAGFVMLAVHTLAVAACFLAEMPAFS